MPAEDEHHAATKLGNNDDTANSDHQTSNEENANFWNKIADSYAKKPLGNPQAYQLKLDEMKKVLHADSVVLEIGCGTGTLALDMAPHVQHVHAVDISSEMIRIARKKAAAANIDNVTFYDEPVETIAAFEKQSFDVVTAFNILHLVPSMSGTLQMLRALIKPDGTFVSSTPCIGEHWYVPFGIILPIVKWLGVAPGGVQVLKVAELQGHMERAGFTDIRRLEVGNGKSVAFMVAQPDSATTHPLGQSSGL